MNKALIIEDEPLSAQSLEKLLAVVEPQVEVVAQLQGVEDAVEWFQSNELPDVVFLDIHLADGSAFRIFDQVEITCPIIFTTAYDQYALEAFKVNSVDYLLKPISEGSLRHALEKLRTLSAVHPDTQVKNLIQTFRERPHYQSVFLIPLRDQLIPVNVVDIACFYIDTKSTYLLTFSGRRFALDGTLDALTLKLDPEKFFRANRQYIVARSAVKEISIWLGGKLSIALSVDLPERIVISKNNANTFKKWYMGLI